MGATNSMQENESEKRVQVDIFQIPANKVDEFLADRDFCEKEVRHIMEPYCAKIERKVLDEEEGEAIVGYIATGGILFDVVLDPFEVPVMKVAHERGRLKEYIMAANGLTDEILDSLK